MTTSTTNDNILFLNNTKKSFISKSNFYQRWWNQQYEHQHLICQIFEHNLFYKITLILLIFDCIFVITQTILDFIKIKSECSQKSNSIINQYKYKIEILTKILHYLSINILTLFIFELFIKIYIYGKEFWNINKRKLEYFDGFIVIFSYVIDIYFLLNEKTSFIEYRFEMITIIRMWRIIRIINSVVQYTMSTEQKKKDLLNSQYIITIEQFINLLKYKTNSIENIREDFIQIDNQVQYYLEQYKESNQQISILNSITKFSQQLQNINF